MENHLADPNSSSFQTSKDLKHLYSGQFELWRKRHRLTQEDLALQCGVTASYLSQIGRYGRIPGKPVLILLALHFGLDSPRQLFEAAGISEPWPLEPGVKLAVPEHIEKGFLSVKLDMDGFTNAIRTIVRNESRPRTVSELTRGAPLRVGFNMWQDFFFHKEKAAKPSLSSLTKSSHFGIFPDLWNLLALGLHTETRYTEKLLIDGFAELKSGELDAFGPVFTTPKRLGIALYSEPFCTVGISALWRKNPAAALKKMPIPKSLEEVKSGEYKIAVLRDTMSHHFALTDLALQEEDLVICDVPEEAFERIVLGSIPRPAHLMIADSLTAFRIHKQHIHDCDLLFSTDETVLGTLENVIAVRPDWPELVTFINDTLKYGFRGGAIFQLFKPHLVDEIASIVSVASPH